MQDDEHLMQAWGRDYPFARQAIDKYPTDGFIQTPEQANERGFKIAKEFMRLKRLAEHNPGNEA